MTFKNTKQNLVRQFIKIYERNLAPLSEADKKKFTGYFYILLTLAALAFFGLFAISPTVNTISNLSKQYKDNKLILNALNTKLSNFKTLDAEYLQVQNSVDQIYSAIPKQTEIPRLTRQLETLAASRNLQVTGLTFNTVEIYPNSKDDPIFSFLFTLNLSGNESDINSFIKDVINFDRIIGIERLSTGHDQESRSTLSFTGRTFFAPK